MFRLYYIIGFDAVLNRLLNLKVAKDRKGKAPNKPLLVLAILDLVEVEPEHGTGRTFGVLNQNWPE